jgi:predicted metal-dependent phosphoesterase TrpH
MGFADLHVHTIYSYDGTASVPAVLARARQVGLDVIAITDHDELRGSLKALELAPDLGIGVIPGVEITTSEGDLIALNITKEVKSGQFLIPTILRVGEAGGFCIAPHPMAGGFGMKSLSTYSILKALRHPDAARILIGIETYNATAIDKLSNHYAHILGEHLKIAKLGNSDAHILEAIGLGMTEFIGHTAKDLIRAIYSRETVILGSWATSYIASTFTRLVNAA